MKELIDIVWNNRDLLKEKKYSDAVKSTLEKLNKGEIKVAEKIDSKWIVNEWVKKAVILFFPLMEMKTIELGPFEFHDKIKLKTNYKEQGVRVVPHAIARYGSFIHKGVVLMPSYVNIGSNIGSGTMIDTWATVGSCAQIGKNVHISGGAGIGGVLEPLQANPVIIEDNCFIGARSEIAEGVIVETGSVISMGVYIGASTKIIDRETGETFFGKVPPYSVVVPGTISTNKPENFSQDLNLYCAVIVKKVDEKTRSKTSINELLRS